MTFYEEGSRNGLPVGWLAGLLNVSLSLFLSHLDTGLNYDDEVVAMV